MSRFELVRLFTHNILKFLRYILNSEWHPTHLSTPSSQCTARARTLLHSWDPTGNNLVEVYLIIIYWTYLMQERFVLKSSRNFRGCSLLVGIFLKYKFLCANTDIRGVERRPLRQPSPTSPGNHVQKSLPGRSLSISSDMELTAYVPWAISWDRGYKQGAVGWFKEGNGKGRMARRRYRSNFPWLSCWLKERKRK